MSRIELMLVGVACQIEPQDDMVALSKAGFMVKVSYHPFFIREYQVQDMGIGEYLLDGSEWVG